MAFVAQAERAPVSNQAQVSGNAGATRDTGRQAQVLGDAATFDPHTPGKKCGGFHPDWFVSVGDGWSAGDLMQWYAAPVGWIGAEGGKASA